MSSKKSKENDINEREDDEPFQQHYDGMTEPPPVPEDANIENMTALNDKLHGDLEGVIIAVETQLKRIYQREKTLEDANRGIGHMRNELEDSYAKIESLTKEINKIKETLYENLDANSVVNLENELKNLK